MVGDFLFGQVNADNYLCNVKTKETEFHSLKTITIMATTAINETGNQSAKKTVVKETAKMAAAAGVGAVGGAFADDLFLHDGKESTGEHVTPPVQPEEPNPAEVTEETAFAAEPIVQPEPLESDPSDGPQPITSETVAYAQPTPFEDVQTPIEEVNPDLIAQEIISGEEIDPDDIDMEDIVNFADVGTIYGADGQEYAAAIITDDWGNEMTVIDVNNDDEFDLVVDNYGNPVQEMPGHLNVSDAELAVNADAGYLAPTANDLPVVTDEMLQDIIQS